MDINKLIESLPTDRKSRSWRPRRRGAYMRRPVRPPDDLLAYLVKNRIRTTGDLRKYRQPTDPTLYDYVKQWGSWKEAQIAAYGAPLLFTAPTRPSADYLLRCVLSFNLWTRDAYCRARRENPEVIPSVYWCKRLFGGRFDNLKWAAEKVSVTRCWEKYLSLSRRLGRQPTADDCRQYGLDMTPLKTPLSKEFLPDLLRLANSPAHTA